MPTSQQQSDEGTSNGSSSSTQEPGTQILPETSSTKCRESDALEEAVSAARRQFKERHPKSWEQHQEATKVVCLTVSETLVFLQSAAVCI